MSWKIRLLRCHLLPVRPQRIAAFTASIIARMISAGCCCSGAADIHRFFTSASMVLRPAQHVMSLSPYFGLSAPAHKAALLDMDDRQHSSLNWSKRRNEAQPVVMAMTAFKLQPTLAKLRQEGTDWIFIDLPGRDAPAANAGLAAADYVLIPCGR